MIKGVEYYGSKYQKYQNLESLRAVSCPDCPQIGPPAVARIKSKLGLNWAQCIRWALCISVYQQMLILCCFLPTPSTLPFWEADISLVSALRPPSCLCFSEIPFRFCFLSFIQIDIQFLECLLRCLLLP